MHRTFVEADVCLSAHSRQPFRQVSQILSHREHRCQARFHTGGQAAGRDIKREPSYKNRKFCQRCPQQNVTAGWRAGKGTEQASFGPFA